MKHWSLESNGYLKLLSKFHEYFNAILSTLLRVDTGNCQVGFIPFSLRVELWVQISSLQTRYIYLAKRNTEHTNRNAKFRKYRFRFLRDLGATLHCFQGSPLPRDWWQFKGSLYRDGYFWDLLICWRSVWLKSIIRIVFLRKTSHQTWKLKKQFIFSDFHLIKCLSGHST